MIRPYQGGKLPVVAEVGVHWEELTECLMWMRIAAKPGLGLASGLCSVSG